MSSQATGAPGTGKDPSPRLISSPAAIAPTTAARRPRERLSKDRTGSTRGPVTPGPRGPPIRARPDERATPHPRHNTPPPAAAAVAAAVAYRSAHFAICNRSSHPLARYGRFGTGRRSRSPRKPPVPAALAPQTTGETDHRPSDSPVFTRGSAPRGPSTCHLGKCGVQLHFKCPTIVSGNTACGRSGHFPM
jgi:hypothetical protein